MEAIGGNNHRGAWYFHSGPYDDLPTIGELPHFSRNFNRALSVASESPESSRIVPATKIPARTRSLTTPHR